MKLITFKNMPAIPNEHGVPAECVVVGVQSFPDAVAIFIFQKCTCFNFTHNYILFLRKSRAPNLPSIHLCVHLRGCVFQICDDFHYPGAGPPDMRISSIDFNDSRLRACLDVGGCSRAMISNVLRACRVHGAEPESTENRMAWRTPVSQTSAWITFWRASALASGEPPRQPRPLAVDQKPC